MPMSYAISSKSMASIGRCCPLPIMNQIRPGQHAKREMSTSSSEVNSPSPKSQREWIPMESERLAEFETKSLGAQSRQSHCGLRCEKHRGALNAILLSAMWLRPAGGARGRASSTLGSLGEHWRRVPASWGLRPSESGKHVLHQLHVVSCRLFQERNLQCRGVDGHMPT